VIPTCQEAASTLGWTHRPAFPTEQLQDPDGGLPEPWTLLEPVAVCGQLKLSVAVFSLLPGSLASRTCWPRDDHPGHVVHGFYLQQE
jgi:hypothetical protein